MILCEKKFLEPTNEKSLKLFWSNCQNPEIKNRKIAKIDNILKDLTENHGKPPEF